MQLHGGQKASSLQHLKGIVISVVKSSSFLQSNFHADRPIRASKYPTISYRQPLPDQ